MVAHPPKIIVLDGATVNPGDNPWDAIGLHGTLAVYDRTPDYSIIDRARDADILITNKAPLSAATLQALPNLRFIAVTATGFNIVDVEAAGRSGIPVSNVPEYGSLSVAQHAIALLLSLANGICLHAEAVRRGDWITAEDFSFCRSGLVELAGKVLGIVGLGRIGRQVAITAHALGMEIVAHNPRSRVAPERVPVRWVDVDELFASSDVISLHCPLTADNGRFVDSRLLGRMKNSAFLINTARGALIDEDALATALATGTIAGAGLDVVAEEPMRRDNPLFGAPNCLITPHIAWASVAARRRLMAATAENVAAFLAGAPINVINSRFLQQGSHG